MNTQMKAITICVDYSDILKLTLPRNRSHFSDYLIVTTFDDYDTQTLAAEYGCSTFLTNAFYRHGAMFNKGLAMEEGFDVLGREDWIMVLDADTILPTDACFDDSEIGKLYSPYRHMLEEVERYDALLDWSTLPVRPDFEHCGYCTYFHASDSHLSLPWYGLNWKHAGGCDSEFQAKWPLVNRYRPSWKVLHLGPTDTNWCGRVSGKDRGLLTDTRRENMHKVLHTYRRAELNIPMSDLHKITNVDLP